MCRSMATLDLRPKYSVQEQFHFGQHPPLAILVNTQTTTLRKGQVQVKRQDGTVEQQGGPQRYRSPRPALAGLKLKTQPSFSPFAATR